MRWLLSSCMSVFSSMPRNSLVILLLFISSSWTYSEDFWISDADSISLRSSAYFRRSPAANSVEILERRLKRQSASERSSILTVEWEGIHTRVASDAIGGFQVEYRPEHEDRWIQHDGIIPYKGPDYQYRVRIKDLPSGIIYLVRINVMDKSGHVITSTPPIRANEDNVKVVCDGEVSTPRNVRIESKGQHLLQFSWDQPECGDILHYYYRLEGYDEWAQFDVREAATEATSVTIRDLLPGTTYSFKLKAIDSGSVEGPWVGQALSTQTEGSPPAVSGGIKAIYRTDRQIRIEWEAYPYPNLQHYEVILAERKPSGIVQLFRPQVPADQNFYVFNDLTPNTKYLIGVIAIADSTSKQTYHLETETARQGAQSWSATPSVSRGPLGKFQVRWDVEREFIDKDPREFLVEYRFPNETGWRRYGKTIPFRPGLQQYVTDIEGLSGKIIYVFRVYLIDDRGQVVAVTDEFNVGTGLERSCAGPAGVPLDIQSLYAGPLSITYVWKQPACDESYGPIEGYEYKHWNIDRGGAEPERPAHTNERKATLVNLDPESRYGFKVRSRSRSGHSSWSGVTQGQTKPKPPKPPISPELTDRPYQLRVILAAPSSYLAWQPPKDKGPVTRFRLRIGKAQKPAVADWRTIDEPPGRFRCPQHVGNPGDFCYELSGLQFGVQYNANVAARSESGAWTPEQNLHFVLVEARPQAVPGKPKKLRVKFLSPTRAEVSWDPPDLHLTPCDEYKLTIEVLDTKQPDVRPGAKYSLRVPGNVYSQIVDDLRPSTTYNVSVEAGFNGNYGPAIWEVIHTKDIRPEISQPRVSQRGGQLTISWDVSGDLESLCCYQIDVQRFGDSRWQPLGNLVPQQGQQSSYSSDLVGLEGNTEYYLRVRGLAVQSRDTLCTSPNVRVTTQCEAPRTAPVSLEGSSPDGQSVLLVWKPPDRASWGCAEIYYIIEGTANGQPQRFQVRPDPRGYTVEHRIPSEPDVEWRLRVQTANSGGVSGWSNEVVVRVEPIAYVSTPRLTPQGSQIQVDWQSQGRGAGKVIGYLVEYRSDRQPVWQRHGSVVPYRGDQQPYTSTLTGVQIGSTYFVRIQVLDRSQRVIYTSPEASTQTRCGQPTEPPTYVQASAPDSRHVRVTWQSPPVETWQCDDIRFEVEATEPQGTRPETLGRAQLEHVFTAKPNQKWVVRVRTVNSAGHSPWSREATTTTRTGDLIEGLQVTYPAEIPTLTWRSVPDVDDIVSGYNVEYRAEAEQRWAPHSSGQIPYVGAQRPYSVRLDDLPEGRTVFVRVNVFDRSNQLAFTSQPLAVQMPRKCRPPAALPSELECRSSSAAQISLLWRPLPRSEWNCDTLWYIVKYTTTSVTGVQTGQGFRNFTAVESIAQFDSTPATNWDFEIHAANPSGNGPVARSRSSECKTESSIPGEIRDLNVVALGPDSVRATWRQPEDPNGIITGYELTYQLISRGLCQPSSPEREITVWTQTPSYIIQSLVPHSRYKISVAAKTTALGSRLSKEVTTEQSTPNAAPQAVQARSDDPYSAAISWQAPPCVETNGEISKYEYAVEGTDPWALSEIRQLSTADTRAAVDGLTPFTRYRVRVRAFTAKGEGPWSSEVFFTTKSADSAPAPPVVKITGKTADSISLVWQSPFPPHGEIDAYKIQFALTGTGRFKEEVFRLDQIRCAADILRIHQSAVPKGAEVHCATIEHLSPAQYYDFQVAARISGRNWGAWSNTVSGQTGDLGPVEIQSIEKVSATENSLSIRWTVAPADQTRVTGFMITAHPLGDIQKVQQYTVDASTYTYRIDGLDPDTTYNVTAQARTVSGIFKGKSANMETGDVVPPPMANPPRVIDRKHDSITVEWTSPSKSIGLIGYILEYQIPSRTDWTQYGQQIPHEPHKAIYTAKVGGLTPNTDVLIRLKPVVKGNRIGSPSPEARARTECLAPSSPPSNVRADGKTIPNQVRLTWEKPNEASWNCDQIGFEILYHTDKAPKELSVRVGPQQTEYLFPSAPNVIWYLKMRTTNRAGSSPPSSEVEAKTQGGAPGPVRDLKVTSISPNDVRLTWQEPLETHGPITGYDISYRLLRILACPASSQTKENWITVYSVKDRDYTLSGLLPYSEYEVKVAARTTELGPAETKTIITEQSAPTASPRSLQDKFKLERSITFTWEPPDCKQQHGLITNYQYELLGLDDWAKLDIRIANTTQTQVNLDNLTPFTKYRFKVKAFTIQGAGPSTSSLDTMTTEAEAPLSPQDLTVVTEGIDFIIVSWLPPYPPYGTIDSYRLQYRQTDGSARRGSGDWTSKDLRVEDSLLRCEGAPAGAPRVCYKITGLEPGTRYGIQVAAHIRDRSYGKWSQEVPATTLVGLGGQPLSISLIEKTPISLTVGWRPPTDPLGKIVSHKITIDSLKPGVGPKERTATVNMPTVQLKLEDLEPDTPYNVTVQAGTTRGYGPGISATYSTEIGVVPVVDAPTISAIGSNYLTVEWSGVSDKKLASQVQGYILEYRSYQEPSWREFSGVVKHDNVKRTYMEKITNLLPDTTYVVRVKVISVKNKVGEPSKTAEARTGCEKPTSPPLNIHGTAPSSNQVRVTWQSPSTESWRCSAISYILHYQNGTGGPQSSIELPSSRNDHTFNSGPFTMWTIHMQTKNQAGTSDKSNEVRIGTPEGLPGKVTGVIATPTGPDRAKVSWDEPTEPNGVITGYVMSYWLKSKGACPVSPGQPVTKPVHREKQVVKDLEPATTYELTIAAKTYDFGPPSDPVLFTTEEAAPTGPPTHLEAPSIHPTSATFTWDEPVCEQRNGEITRYEYILEGLDAWAKEDVQKSSVSQERAELGKLIPYTRYSFKVRALNSKGAGPFTNALEILTKPGIPPAPQDVRSEIQYPHAVLISFLPPSPPNGKIDEYRVRYTLTDRISWNEARAGVDELVCAGDFANRQRLCHQIGDLQPEKEYGIQVAAHTEGGDWGEWSKAIYTTTPFAKVPIPDEIPRITDRKSTQMTVLWHGISGDYATSVGGYILEYSSGESSQWQQYEDTIPSKGGKSEIHSKVVQGLTPDTLYFFRLRIVHKNGKSGEPGPHASGRTLCGRPTEPPQNIQVTSPDCKSVKVTWEAPSQKTWKCGQVAYTLKFSSDSANSGVKTFSSSDRNEHTFEALPGSKWTINMRTEAQEAGESGQIAAGEASEWSDTKKHVAPCGVPTDIFLEVRPVDWDKLQVSWELPDDYPFGVDLQYQLIQKGACQPAHFPPVTEYNVEDRKIILKDLEPYSKYEVTVRPRVPPHLVQSGVTPPKMSEVVRTGEKEPTGPPLNVRAIDIQREQITFTWDPPECDQQNGDITTSQYEYMFTGKDDWVKDELKQAATSRRRVLIGDLLPGTRYLYKVKAYTKAGAGPWSNEIEVKTIGNELGPPRELHPVAVDSNSIVLSWLPPFPSRTQVDRYKLKYSKADRYSEKDVDLSVSELSCSGIAHRHITPETLCYRIKDLQPSTTYTMMVQGQSSTGNWGEWSPELLVTTKAHSGYRIDGGSLTLLSAGKDRLKVKWIPPDAVEASFGHYIASVAEVYGARSGSPTSTNVGRATIHEFTGLKPYTTYNVTVEAYAQAEQRLIWHISNVYVTTDKGEDILAWLPAPTNLRLLEKTETSMHITWDPPEILLPAHRELITHYLVTYAAFDPLKMETGPYQRVEVPKPGLKLWMRGLEPATVYNITIQAGTKQGLGDVLWGAYSTLEPGEPHILKLRHRTPTSLHVYWTSAWGIPIGNYKLVADPLHSVDPKADLDKQVTNFVEGTANEFVIKGLHPQTIYNVTLQPLNTDLLAWGAYATLPPGAFVVTNLKACDETPHSVAFSWDPIDDATATNYQVRYATSSGTKWIEKPQRSRYELRCPGDPCNKLCYAVYNLEGGPDNNVIQVRAFVEGSWNRWKTLVRGGPIQDEGPPVTANQLKPCCIVPPDFFVENVGDLEAQWKVKIGPVPPGSRGYLQRYYVVVDERDPAIAPNETLLFDMVTAKARGHPFYITASFDNRTLTEEQMFPIGDGRINGGYINYPLIKGKKYNWHFVAVWDVDGKPIYGIHHDSQVGMAYIGSWPWWWLLLLLLLLMLIILVLCCLLWCCHSRYKRKKDKHRILLNGRSKELLDGAGKGNFEDGYAKGFRDGSKMDGAGARAKLDSEYGRMGDRFREGYLLGLQDAGARNLTTSMTNVRQPEGYSAGYMQGFRDGDSGLYGDRITTSLLRRLEEMYPNQDAFRTGYLDGYRDSLRKETTMTHQTTDQSKLVERLSEIQERLNTLDNKKGKGDEIHTTRIYHVYNQLPEGQAVSGGVSTAGAQLAQELEEIQSSSRRSTLRKHYTPGDYLKYPSDTEGSVGLTGRRRTMSASNLGREEYGPISPPFASTPGGRQRDLSSSRVSVNAYNDTFGRRYQYRSRSDVGAAGTGTLPRRYGSQTILEGPRPGPSTPLDRRDALESLQRELSTLSRSSNRQAAGATTLLSSSGIGGQSPSPGARAADYRSGAGGAFSSELSKSYGSETGHVASSKPLGQTGEVGRRRPGDENLYDYDSYEAEMSHSKSHRAHSSSHGRPAGGAAFGRSTVADVPLLSIGSYSGSAGISPAPTHFTATSAASSATKERVIYPKTLATVPLASASAASQRSPSSPGASGFASGPTGSDVEAERVERLGDGSWTDELMKIVKEPMPDTLDRMKKYNTSMSQLPATTGAGPTPSTQDPSSSKRKAT